MLVVAKEGREEDVRAILGRWDLDAELIGRVTETGRYVVRENGVVVVDIPGEPLVDACPTYTRQGVESPEITEFRAADLSTLQPKAEEADPTWTLLRLLDSPTIASKRWVYEQYDSTVRTNTVVGPGSDAAVIRLRGTRKAIAATVDCNARYVYLNPYRGGQIAVAEAARNLACSGALPRAVTDNLNFGNPLKPEVYHQLSESLRGIGEACAALETPVTGGNVSLYNENPRGAIYPTPTIGMVGVIDDVAHVTTSAFRESGDAIILLGTNTDEIGGSEYLKVIHGRVAGDAPAISLDGEVRLQTALLSMIRSGWIQSAHDTAEGGLAVALAESAIADPAAPLGIEVELDDALPPHALLFGEAQGRVVISCADGDVEDVLAKAAEHGVPARRIGTVGAPFATFIVRTRGGSIEAPASELAHVYENAIPRRMEGSVADVETSLESVVQHGQE
ncbi:MAG TPA: AIR synthase related protein, partial [Longimicrobium sp.]|nr:AIR synthase related protein [Longimicrobium sp.]